MIFGKNYSEIRKANRAKMEYYKTTRIPVFAWYPIRTNTGRWVWGQRIYKQYFTVYELGNRLVITSPIYYIEQTGEY